MTTRRAIVGPSASSTLLSPASRRGQRRWLSAVMIAASLSAAASAFAQVQVVDHGHALDANPMVGGGGGNKPIPGFVPVNTNAIQTGNVTGLGAFHGNDPIKSTLEFSGHLPSASLENFNRVSAGDYSTTYTGQTQTFYTPSSIVSTASGQINSGLAAGGFTNPVGATLVGAAAANPNTGLQGLTSLASGTSQLQMNSSSTPATADIARLSSATAAPGVDDSQTDSLFGLRRTLHPEPLVSRVDPDTGQTIRSAASDQVGPDTGALQQGITVRPTPQPKMNMTADQVDPWDPNNPDKQPKIDPNDMGARSRVNDSRMPDVVNDRVRDKPIVAKQVNPTQAGRTLNAVAVRGPEPFQVSESYLSVMDRLKKLSPSNLKYQPAGLTDEGAIPDSTRFALPSDSATAPQYDPITGELKPAKGKTQSTDPTRPDYRPRDYGQVAAGGAGAVAGAATQPEAATTMPNSLTESRKPASIPELLTRGDADLVGGRYMHAADTFQSALRMDPTHSQALLGLAHAELAAGLYESAAYNLRFLFGLKPELIPAIQDIRKIISDRRLQYVEEDLKKVAARKEENSAFLLLCYLYYQTADKDNLKTTMDQWAKKSPNDQFQIILRPLWLDRPANKH